MISTDYNPYQKKKKKIENHESILTQVNEKKMNENKKLFITVVFYRKSARMTEIDYPCLATSGVVV